MSALDLTVDALCSVLAETPPLELLGTKLLRLHRPQGRLIPPLQGISREELGKAVQELVDYSQRCYSIAERLGSLTAVPLRSVMVPEFGL